MKISLRKTFRISSVWHDSWSAVWNCNWDLPNDSGHHASDGLISWTYSWRKLAMDFLIHHMLRNSSARYPEKEAIVHGTRRLSYREVADSCASIACGLRSAGVQRGDRVGIYLDPSVEQVFSIFSISQAGGVYVPINTVLVPEQVAHIARDCGMKALITTPDKLE